MPTEKTQTRSRNKTENKPKKNHAKTKNPKQNTASAGQFMTSVTWRKVIALYHPRCFFVPEPVAFRRVYGTWNLLVYHVTIAAPYPGGIDPQLAVYARSWDGHYTTTRRDRLYHPRCHPQDWKDGQTKQNKTGNNHRSRHTNSVRRETNTTLHGNQGSPQPGAPKSQCKPHGQ